MSRSIRWFLVFVCFSAGLCPSSVLAEIWDDAAFAAAPSALLTAASAVAPEDGADVQVLLRERIYRLDPEGRGTVQDRWIYRILTPVGVQGWSSISAQWAPWHQERPRLRARVVTADGAEHWLDDATVSESPVGDAASDVYSDRLQLGAPLPATAPGAVVEGWIEMRDTAPLFDQGTVQIFSFGMPVPVDRTRLVIEAPAELPLRYVVGLLPQVEPRRTESEGWVRLSFEAHDLDAFESIEPFASSDVPVEPTVTFATGESWARVARGYSDVVDARIGDADLAAVVGPALEGASGRDDKVARLLAWLHSEVRYTGVELGEAAIVPRSPAETLRRKYGDCKDKATLLVALLRTAEIPASVALLATGPGRDVEPELPGLGVFDHAIVYVPGSDGAAEVWIDPTHEFAAAGELPLGDQGRLALVAGPATTGLVATPAAAAEHNRTVETREVFLNADLGAGRVVETSEAWGSVGLAYRREFADKDSAKLKERFASYVKSAYVAEELVHWEMSDPRDFATPFRLRLEAQGAKVAFTDMADAAVNISPAYLLGRLPSFLFETEDEEPAVDAEPGITSRQSDLELPEPHTVEWRYRIVPPDGYRPVALPEPEVRALGPATLTREVTVKDGGEVELLLRFDTVRRRFTPEEVAALRTGVQELREEGTLPIRFEQVAERHLAAGEIKQAFAELDGLVARAPERGLPHVRRASALLAAGFGEAARREAHRAIEIEPELDRAYQALGWIEQHDLLGRRFHQGFDREAAIAAYRRARDLDPKNTFTRSNLAILLEHDAEGMRYSPQAFLEEAIAEYRALFEISDDTGLEENLVIALAHAGRFAEGEELARRLAESPNRNAFLLVCIAASQGTDAALREALTIGDSGKRRAALGTAGWSLAELRLYDPAAELTAAAAKGASNATKLLASSEMLRRTRRHEELDLTAGNPPDLVRKLLTAGFLGDEGELRRLFSRRIPDHLADGEAREMRDALGLRAVAREHETPLDTLVDLRLADLQVTSNGTDVAGYRVRWNLNGVRFAVFVVAEEEGYRYFAAEDGLPRFGEEALRHLEAGEIESALQWLDWARDLTSAPSAEDPFAGEPFFWFWQHRAQAGPEDIRAAAASLITGGPAAETVISFLEAQREAAASEEERRRYEMAVAQAYSELGRHSELLALARQWLTVHTESAAAFDYQVRALTGMERWDELDRAIRDRLDLLPADPVALQALVNMAGERGDIDREAQAYQLLIDRGDAESYAYNNLAWNAVVRGKVDEQALAHAQKAVSMSGSTIELNTLAAVYAELGKNTEAREILLKSIERGEPDSADWWIVGRIAESYGILDAAIDAYRRVEQEDDEVEVTSPYRLAQQRLERLDAKTAS